MAGYFVKMDIDLAESEEVVLISEMISEPVDAVIGKLYRFWRWVERHCGASRGVTRVTLRVTLARVTGVTVAFVEALENVGWLRNENDVFVIPNWEKRFSHTAKVRSSNADRQRRYRERKSGGKCVTSRRDKTLRNGVTEALPETDIETDIEVIPPISPKGERRRFTPPALEEVRQYCLERSKGVDPEAWYDHYTANGWKVGKNAMKDWKAAVRQWERSEFRKAGAEPVQQRVPNAEDLANWRPQ